MQVDELSSKYLPVSIEEVEEGWKDVYERSLDSCMHGPSCQQGPGCQVCTYSLHLHLESATKSTQDLGTARPAA